MNPRPSPSRRRAAPLRSAITPPLFDNLERRTLFSGADGLGSVGEWLDGIVGGDDSLLGTIFEPLKHGDDDDQDDDGHGGDDDNSGPGSGSDDDDDDDDQGAPAAPAPTPTPAPTPAPEDDHPRPGRGRDEVAPTATIQAGDIVAPSTDDHTITITYTDDKKIKAKSIDADDLTVTGPGGVDVDVTDVSINPDKDKDVIVATYSLAAPGGRWSTLDNGTYTVTLRPDEVIDNKGNAAAGGTASFQVNIAAPVDTTGPAGTIAVENVTSAGGNTHQVKVTYTDDIGVNLASIGPGDLDIEGPKGARAVRSVSLSPNSDGTRVTATYTFGAPGGSWDAGDNGTYTVTLNANQVRDGGDNGATAAAATFTVDFPVPQPVDPGFGGGGAGGGGNTGGNTGGSGGGVGGAVQAPFIAEAVVAQADGKLVVAGRQGSIANGTSQAVIQRYNSDGVPDKSFGAGGKVVTAVGANDAYYAIALNAAGQIVVAGTRGGDVLVSRFNPDGTLDASYARGGSSVTDFGAPDDAAYALGIAADGSVVAAGGPGGNIAFARFLPSGLLNPNFGQGGIQAFDLGSPDDTPGAVAFQDNKVVIVGTSGGKVAVVRVRDDGEADETFSGDGLLLLDALSARTDADFRDRSTAAAVQADGKLLLANRTAGGDFAVARLNTNGALDASFGAGGVATVDFGGTDDDADAVLVQDTGEILVIGTTNAGGVANTAVAALDTSGALIADFGAGGKLTLTPDAAAAPRVLHLGDLVLRAFGTRQPDGRIVIGTTNGNAQSGGGGSAGNNSGGNTGGGVGTPSQQTTSLRRLNVPGTRSTPQGTQVGTFGVVDGKRESLTLTDADGTDVTFAASRGSGVVYSSGGRYNLTLSDGAVGASVTIRTTAGGDGRVTLGDVAASGNLRSLVARTADLFGTLYASGSIGKLTLGGVTGGVIAAAGSITSASVASLTGARVMAGMGLGADAKLGGTNAEADSVTAATIGSVRVTGAIESSTISAGLDPVDGVFNNADDRVVGGAESSIRVVSARSADPTTRCIAGKIGALRLPGGVDLKTDERVRLLTT